MIELLLFAAGLALCIAVSAVASLPFVVFGLRSVQRTPPERRALRALLWSLAAALASSFVLGVGGFVWGASVGDESAGTIAIAMWAVGSVAGAIMGGGGTFAIVMIKSRRARV